MSTCTVPGYPSCSISCPSGCIAVCCPCRTRCSGSDALEEMPPEPFSIQISDMKATEVARILGAHLPRKIASTLHANGDKPISLSLADTTIAQLAEAIEKHLA
jgi:hypothetical protein